MTPKLVDRVSSLDIRSGRASTTDPGAVINTTSLDVVSSSVTTTVATAIPVETSRPSQLMGSNGQNTISPPPISVGTSNNIITFKCERITCQSSCKSSQRVRRRMTSYSEE